MALTAAPACPLMQREFAWRCSLEPADEVEAFDPTRLLAQQGAALTSLQSKLHAATTMLASVQECCLALQEGHQHITKSLKADGPCCAMRTCQLAVAGGHERMHLLETSDSPDVAGRDYCKADVAVSSGRRLDLYATLELPELARTMGQCVGIDTVVRICGVSSFGMEYMRAVRDSLKDAMVLSVCALSSSRTEFERLCLRRPHAPVSPAVQDAVPSWECAPLPPRPTVRGDCTAVVADGSVYVLGGLARGPALATAERLDVSDGRWHTLPSMPTGRYSCTAVAHRGVIFVLGGLGCGKPLAAAEAYYPLTGRWGILPSMPKACANGAAVVAHGSLYVLGGYAGHGLKYHSLATSQRLQLDAERWDQEGAVKPMPTARRCCAAVVVRSSIAVLGGLDSDGDPVNNVEKLQLPQGVWERMAPMPVVRGPCLAASFSGNIFVLSSAILGDGVCVAARYDSEEERWLPMPSASCSSGLHAAALAFC